MHSNRIHVCFVATFPSEVFRVQDTGQGQQKVKVYHIIYNPPFSLIDSCQLYSISSCWMFMLHSVRIEEFYRYIYEV